MMGEATLSATVRLDAIREVLFPRAHYASLVEHVVRKLTGCYLEGETRERKAFGIIAGRPRGQAFEVTAVLPLLVNLRHDERYRRGMDEIVDAHAIPSQTPNAKRGWLADPGEVLSIEKTCDAHGWVMFGSYHTHRVPWPHDPRRDTCTRLDRMLAAGLGQWMFVVSAVDLHAISLRAFYEGDNACEARIRLIPGAPVAALADPPKPSSRSEAAAVDVPRTYADVVAFHGHECPGAAVGVHVAELALARLGRHSEENPIVAVSETDTCAVDAIQVLTGCTFGKRNLVHVDNGKNIFTFWHSTTGRGLRVRARPGTDAYRDRQTLALAEKIEQGTATDGERQRFADLQAVRTKRILNAAPDDLLLVENVTEPVPTVKAVRPSLPCQGCGDLTSTTILHNHRGQMLCPPCHLKAHDGVMAHHGVHVH